MAADKIVNNRLGLQSREDLTSDAARDVHDKIDAYLSSGIGDVTTSQDPGGQVGGPYGVLLHTPAVAIAFQQIMGAVSCESKVASAAQGQDVISLEILAVV